MVVYGGQLDNGNIIDEMLTFVVDTDEWQRVQVKNPIEGFAHAACCQTYQEEKKGGHTCSGRASQDLNHHESKKHKFEHVSSFHS